MADQKDSAPIELVAVERGFRNGVLVEPGARFTVEKGAKVPKWAVPADQYQARKPRPFDGDLRPKATQVAVKQKTGALAGVSQN